MPMKQIAAPLLLVLMMCWAGGWVMPSAVARQAGKQAPRTTSPEQEKTPARRAAVDPKQFAIVISGAGGEGAYSKKVASQAQQLYDALITRLGFDEKRVYLLTENVISNSENMTQGNFA